MSQVIRTRTSLIVAEYIRDLIYSGELREGDKVDRERIARDLGTSQIPVREAIDALTREGMVRQEFHRGAFVEAITRESVIEQIALFGVLTGYALERVVETGAGPGLERRLRILLKEFRAETPALECHAIVRRWMMVIHAAGGGAPLRALLMSISSFQSLQIYTIPAARTAARGECHRILRALRAEDGAAAAAALHSFIRRVTVFALDRLVERGVVC